MHLCPDGHTGARRQRASLRIAAALVFAVLIAAQNSTGVAAQDVAAWRVECASDGKTLDCRAVQQLFQRETRQLVLAILVRKAPDPKAAAITIQLPLGLSLTDPVVMKVDNGQPERQPIQTCTNVGCFVTFTANDKLVARTPTRRRSICPSRCSASPSPSTRRGREWWGIRRTLS